MFPALDMVVAHKSAKNAKHPTKASDYSEEESIIVPVVVVSGSAEDEIRRLFAPHPYDAFLAKPYTIEELRRTLEPS